MDLLIFALGFCLNIVPHSGDPSDGLFDSPQIISVLDPHGNKAIHLAALCGNEKVFAKLLCKPFDLDEKNGDGYPLLHLAILGGNKSIIEKLINSDVSLDETNKQGLNAMMFAIHVGAKEENVLPLLQSTSFHL